MTGASIRVLVADDHRLFRDGVSALLSVTPDLEVVGEAPDADTAVALAAELAPDVVLMDLQMPGGGLSATERIAAAQPDVRVLVLTMFDDDDSVFAALRAGARGYVLKDSEAEDLVRAVRAAAAGEAIFGRSIAERLLTHFGEPRPAGRAPGTGLTASPLEILTPGERNVLRLMARGLNNPAIARELSYSHKTVRNYVSSIFRKLQVADRSQAIVRARDAGLHEGHLPGSLGPKL
jgi:DNA-binding NarL/FixJ family response regulator